MGERNDIPEDRRGGLQGSDWMGTTSRARRQAHPGRLALTPTLRAMAAVALSVTISAPALADQDAAAPPVSEQAPEIRLAGEIVTVPIVMVREHSFVEASIARVAGKLMLDTGYQGADLGTTTACR